MNSVCRVGIWKLRGSVEGGAPTAQGRLKKVQLRLVIGSYDIHNCIRCSCLGVQFSSALL